MPPVRARHHNARAIDKRPPSVPLPPGAGAVALTAALPPGGWLAFAALAVLRFLFGMFQAGGFPGLARVIADWIPAPQRGFAQGTVWTFSRLGGFLAPLLVVWLVKDVFG